jgi:hypothetical protein
VYDINVDVPSGRAVEGVVAWPFACFDSGLVYRRGETFVSVVCCQVEASATAPSSVEMGPTESGASECDLETSTVRRPGPLRAVEA